MMLLMRAGRISASVRGVLDTIVFHTCSAAVALCRRHRSAPCTGWPRSAQDLAQQVAPHQDFQVHVLTSQL